MVVGTNNTEGLRSAGLAIIALGVVLILSQWLGAEQSAKIRMAITEVDLTRRLPGVFASVQSFVVMVLLVVAYVGFLFAESRYVTQKLAPILPDQRRAQADVGS